MALFQRERPSLKSAILFGALDRLTGHGRDIDKKPMSSYRRLPDVARSGSQSKKRSNYQPPPLSPSLPRRRRCITPALEDTEELEQTQSPLFKLPEDILLLIYEQVIGNDVLHIVRRTNRLGNTTCISGSQVDCIEIKCRGLKLPNGACVHCGRPPNDLVPLLQTCRKIYADAIEVLYTSNSFDFDCMETLISFSTCILPQRFDSIRNMQMDLRFNSSYLFGEGTPCNDYARWERMWRIVGSMKNLQHLKVRIVWWRTDLTGAEEARYLSELLQVGKLKVFEVSLPTLQ